MEVKDILKPAITVSEDASFEQALRAMINGQTNTLLAVDSEGVLVGEISVVDLLDAIVPEYLDGDSIASNFATEEMFKTAVYDAKDRLVRDFMSTDFSPINMKDSLLTVAATAISGRRARIPVVDKDNRPLGIISRRGLKSLLAEALNIAGS